MTVTVFVWDMFKGWGVGHASMLVESKKGNIYVSFWPQQHSMRAGWSSLGKVHFMNADRQADGTPQWASKPLQDLDEAAIIDWWSTIQSDPIIDYNNKKPFQISKNEDTYARVANGRYRIFDSQCSTKVVHGLLIGANVMTRAKIGVWLALNAGKGLGPINLSSIPGVRLPTITPKDVRLLVTSTWGDPA